MKILKLEFENINNLKGSHCIDFTVKPLIDADIFAIIGATGSGKSTILDVITLALFNRTPRFRKVSKKTLSEDGSIITRNEKKASAKLTYLVNGNTYISVWNIQYTKQNTLKDHHMELWENGVPLDLHRGKVPKGNENIIGLDYEQFTKAIILSQGEFSKFLKADHSERSVLLEKITGTSIYRELGIKAFEVHREKKNELEKKEEVLNTLKLLSDDEIKTFKIKQTQLKKDLDKYKESLEKTRKNLKQKEDFITTEKQLKTLENHQKLIGKKILESSKNKERLNLHKKVFPFRKELSDFSKKHELIAKNRIRLKSYNEKFAFETKRKAKVITKQQSIVKDEITAENFLLKNSEFEKKVNTLISDLNYIKQDGAKQAKEIEQILKSKYIIDFNFTVNTKPTVVTTEVSKIEQLLKYRNYELTSDTLEIEKDKIGIEKSIQDYKELKKYKEQKKEIEKYVKDNLNHISSTEKLLESLPKKIVPIEKENELLILKVQKVEVEQKIASLDDHRKELKIGEECPLCGSKDHPFGNLEKGEKLSEKLKTLKLELEKNKKQLIEINTEEKVLNSKVEGYKKNNLKYKENLQVLKNRTKNELQNSDLFENIALNFTELLLKAERQKTDLEVVLRAFLKVDPLNSLQNKLEKRLELLVNYKKVLTKKNNLFEGDNVSDVMKKLQNIFNESTANIALHQNNIKNEEQSLKANQTEFQELQKNIELVKQKTGIQLVENLQKAILLDEAVARFEAEQQQLADQKTRNEALLKQTKENFGKLYTEEIEELNLEEIKKEKTELEIKIETVISEISAIKQRLKLNDETTKEKKKLHEILDKARKDFTRWDSLKSLIGDSTGKQFSSFAQGLTLKQLIAFTNNRLKSFSGRYLLYSEPINQELMIVDTLQGNTERSVKTLSGGETFLISLALALSLSDMTSKNVTLDSLFIDEGFGTLDEDSLQDALNLLEKLQSESNKTVGVISHVKELKERISVQIRMQKDSLGHSVIDVFG